MPGDSTRNETPEEAKALVEDEIDKVTSLIASARRLLADDKMVDLAALEGRVRALCDAIGKNPPDDGGRVRERIDAILADLDRLETELTAQNKSFVRRSEAPLRTRASHAYRHGEDDA